LFQGRVKRTETEAFGQRKLATFDYDLAEGSPHRNFLEQFKKNT